MAYFATYPRQHSNPRHGFLKRNSRCWLPRVVPGDRMVTACEVRLSAVSGAGLPAVCGGTHGDATGRRRHQSIQAASCNSPPGRRAISALRKARQVALKVTHHRWPPRRVRNPCPFVGSHKQVASRVLLWTMPTGRSRRGSLCPLRSLRSSSSSALVKPSFWPSSISAWRTQRRSTEQASGFCFERWTECLYERFIRVGISIPKRFPHHLGVDFQEASARSLGSIIEVRGADTEAITSNVPFFRLGLLSVLYKILDTARDRLPGPLALLNTEVLGRKLRA